MRVMRRPNRQMTDTEQIRNMLDECKVLRIGMVSEGRVYVVPMNFGYRMEEDRLTFYLHSAKVGRKIETLRQEGQVCVELDCRHGLLKADSPCSHSYYFASLIGTGRIQVLRDPAEKLEGLQILMEQQTGRRFDNFEEKWVNAVEVLKIPMDEYVCKYHDTTN